jgi:hypothetical protein
MKKIFLYLLIILIYYSCASSEKKEEMINGIQITPYSEGLALYEIYGLEHSSYFIKKRNGEVIKIEDINKYYQPGYIRISFNQFKQGYCAFKLSNPKFLRVGFIDSKGKIIIEPNEIYEDFSEGYSVTKQFGPSKRKVHFINRSGKKVFGDFFNAHSFSEGLAPVWLNAKISEAGKYKYINFYNGKWGFINKNGVLIIEPQFDNALSFSENVAPVLKGAKWYHLIDGFKVLSGGKWGYIFRNGKTSIDFKFDEARNFSDGLAAVLVNSEQKPVLQDIELGKSGFNLKQGGKWGFIDKKGNFIIKPVYDNVFDFKNGKAVVYKNNDKLIINKLGEIISK